MMAATAGELILSRAARDDTALLFEDRSWSFAELASEARRRAGLFEARRREGVPHIGVLLENGPEYFFWLAAAAISGAAVAGINSTYRGRPLAELITYTDCQMVVTSSEMRPLLDGLDLGAATGNVVVVDTDHTLHELASAAACEGLAGDPEDLFLLIFTSGSTGAPKPVRCTQGRFARTGAHVAGIADLQAGRDVVYASLPLFHSSSLFTGWASTLHAGVPIATRRRFSASGTLPDVRRFGATMMTYTGKILNYVNATPADPRDADNPLRVVIGNEASVRDINGFASRFGCQVRDSYGSTEGIIIIRRADGMPDTALGQAPGTVKVIDPDTERECPPARFDSSGRLLNFEEAVGEIVETAPTSTFEGYYKNTEATATRFRNGWYWSGDLAYRDADGWFYFAGRSNEWLRVDSENFAAAPVEAVLGRWPAARSVAVYAVPDDPVGDRVMAAIELAPGAQADPGGLDEFLAGQSDMGTKWTPRFVRFVDELPKLASMKIDKQRLRREAWAAGSVWWRPERGEPLVELAAADRDGLAHLLK